MVPDGEETFDLPPEPVATGALDMDDDAVTPDQFDALISGITHRQGQYTFAISDVTYEKPSQEKSPAGLSVKLLVKTAPPAPPGQNGADKSLDSLTCNFNEFHEPTDGQRKATQIAARDKAALVKGLGLAVAGADGKIHLNQALMANGKGRLVLGSIVHEKGKDGRMYQRIRDWKPISG